MRWSRGRVSVVGARDSIKSSLRVKTLISFVMILCLAEIVEMKKNYLKSSKIICNPTIQFQFNRLFIRQKLLIQVVHQGDVIIQIETSCSERLLKSSVLKGRAYWKFVSK